MGAFKWVRCSFLACIALAVFCPGHLIAQQNSDAKNAPELRDGRHDFDFEIGSWKLHLKRLLHPLTSSTTWIQFDGTVVARKIWDGRANLDEFQADNSSGHIEGLTLRLYSPESHQWSLYWASSKNGTMAVPTIGEFRNGRGEFYDQETLNGRAIFVRFVISDITASSCRFEQAFSDDGGKTWEVNWIATDTRLTNEFEASRTSLQPCCHGRTTRF